MPADCPSTEEIAGALASMSLMIAELEMTVQLTNNEQYQNAIDIMLAEMKSADQVLINYETISDTFQDEWDEYCTYINDVQHQYNQWYKNDVLVTPGTEEIYYSINVDYIETQIEDWVYENLGFKIHLDRSDQSIDETIKEANKQVQKKLDNQLEDASH